MTQNAAGPTLDKGVVGVQSRQMVTLFHRKLAPFQLAADRVPLVEDKDVL